MNDGKDQDLDRAFRSRLRTVLVQEADREPVTRLAAGSRFVLATICGVVATGAIGLAVSMSHDAATEATAPPARTLTVTCAVMAAPIGSGDHSRAGEVAVSIIDGGIDPVDVLALDACAALWRDGEMLGVEFQGSFGGAPQSTTTEAAEGSAAQGGGGLAAHKIPRLEACDAEGELVVIPFVDCAAVELDPWVGQSTR